MGEPLRTREWAYGAAGRVRLDDGGSGGTPVLFIHGGAACRTQWAAQLAHLRPGRRAVAFDLRGMGESERPADENYSIAAMTADVAAVADGLRLGRFVLVGHSYGVTVACAYAGRHPERLAGLVLVDGHGLPYTPSPTERRELDQGFRPERYADFTRAWFESLLVGAQEPVRAAVLAQLEATPREVFMGVIEDGIGYDPRPSLGRYAGPRLAIASVRFETPQSVHRAIPGTPFRLMEGVSHWLMMDRPEEFNAILDEFLAGIEE